MTDRQAFKIVVESPYGKQPTEQFKHFLNKTADEALTRWGIQIEITEITEETE